MEKDRFKRVMDVLDKIADPPYPNGGRQTWTFFIETNLLSSREPSKIFKCSSAKQIVTSTELHEIVKAHLPQEYHSFLLEGGILKLQSCASSSLISDNSPPIEQWERRGTEQIVSPLYTAEQASNIMTQINTITGLSLPKCVVQSRNVPSEASLKFRALISTAQLPEDFQAYLLANGLDGLQVYVASRVSGAKS